VTSEGFVQPVGSLRRPSPKPSLPVAEWPEFPRAWFVVARSRELRPGRIRTLELGERSCALFRTHSGRLCAIDAFCPHMGAHLGHAKVVGERIRCALHQCEIDASGALHGPMRARATRNRWHVRERWGLVFLAHGRPPSAEPPAPSDSQAFVWLSAGPLELRVDWHSMMINAFDMRHLLAVHRRALIEPAAVVRLPDGGLRLEYVSRVTGRGVSDRIMRWLSRDRIRVRQVCYGPLIVIETRLARRRTCAVLGLLPTERGVRAYGSFGVEHGPLRRLRLVLSRWLFLAFLRRDFRVIQGMQLRIDPGEPEVLELARYLSQLPPLEAP